MNENRATATVVPLVKTIPHSLEAEQSLLGGLLVDPEALPRVDCLVSPDDFYASKHKMVFQAVLDLQRQSKIADIVTVSAALTDRGQLAQVGGITYLSHLVDTMPSSANLETYAGIVKEKALSRSLMAAANEINKMCIDDQVSPARERVDRAESLIFTVSQGAAAMETGYIRAGETLHDTINTIERLYEKKQPLTGVPTGFLDLDRLTNGLQPGNLVIIAARPSMGKTALALNIAQYVSTSTDPIPAGLVSLEMTKEELLLRLLAAEANIEHSSLRTGTLAPEDWPRLASAAGKIDAAPLYIDDSPGLNIIDIRARARRLKKQHNVGIIFIDYLQLITPGSRSRNSNREQEISEISRFLKALAKELNIPVVALSQLNRALETREEKRPRLADLRESGAIEQDADVILFIYRDEVYNKDKDDNKGIAEVIIGKQRNGPVGTVELSFIDNIVTFRNHYGR